MTLRLTDGAAEHLAGRPLVVRASLRNGCCGGSAPVPVAEIGPPTDAASFTVMHLGGIEVHVDPRLGPVDGLVVDVDGLWRWRRLRVECERPHDENR
ncbi:MAG: CC/Se motif family (seleno)protein [Acidimicrobiales bacterium]|nr:CC/Se motif family (seleno)protein [Acidimicrobiales bacterium]